MPEAFALLLVLFLLIGIPAIALIALQKTRALERRLGELEANLRSTLARGEGAAPQASEREPAPLPFEELPPASPALTQASGAEAAASGPQTAAGSYEATEGEPWPAETIAPETPVKPSKVKRAPIQWEKWIGIRGAAVAGGLLLALAGLLFFQHAIQSGWITPRMRVLCGALLGTGAIVSGEFFRRREYRFAPAAAAGGGIVALYATTWASYSLYGFTSALVALPMMAAVTGTGAFLSVRFKSQFLAVLGLVGGFATPLLLSVGDDHPLGLFGYILLLDFGLLALGQRMRWPILGLLGVIGSYVVTGAWMVLGEESIDSPIVLLALGSFALAFALGGLAGTASERRQWFVSQATALLLPFVFATYFAGVSDFGKDLWPLAGLVSVLGLGAAWIARRQVAPWLMTGAASGALALTATWLIRSEVADDRLWEFVACTIGMAVIFQLAQRVLRPTSSPGEGPTRFQLPAATLVTLGFALTLLVVAFHNQEVRLAPWLTGALGFGLLLHLQSRGDAPRFMCALGPALAAITMSVHALEVRFTSLDELPTQALDLTWMAAASLGWMLLAHTSTKVRDEHLVRWAWRGCALFPLILLAMSISGAVPLEQDPLLVLVQATLLASCSMAVAMLRGGAGWYAAGLSLFLIRRHAWVLLFVQAEQLTPGGSLLLLELAIYALFAAAPLFARRRLGGRSLAWASAGLFLLFALPSADLHVGSVLDLKASWQASAILCALALVVAGAARLVLPSDGDARGSSSRWLLGTGSFLLALSLARFVDHEVVVVTLALTGLAHALLWRKLGGFGLRLGSLALVGCSALALVLRVLQAFGGDAVFPNGEFVAFNWTSYASAIPALCAVGAAAAIASRERGLELTFRNPTPLLERPFALPMLGLISALLAFLWLNLQVFLYFEEGPYLSLALDHYPARDLTLSISWILYAFLLLAGGLARDMSSLRKASLAFLLLTLAKVFLHDLGDLDGLHRVGSLMGLAVSLLLVSLLYQRFVFPRGKSEPE